VASENHIFKLSNAGGFKALTRYPDMLAGNAVWNPWEPQGAFDALATVTLSATTASVTFAGIPTGYKHLQIRAITRSDMNSGGAWSPISLRFNSDTGSNYSIHSLGGTGASPFAEGYASQTSTTGGFAAPTTNVANSFAISVIDILDYASTAKNKTVRLLTNVENNGSGIVVEQSGSWYSTTAINTITFGMYGGTSGSNYLTNTQFALYGVK
jgi:hypothetical protein